jgi:general L-amino acid transport system permease protein
MPTIKLFSWQGVEMQDPAFVRTEIIEARPEPKSQVAVLGWLRDNLFSSPLNSALTALGLIISYFLLSSSIPWLMNGVWHASSLRECWDIVARENGKGASGPCWAMIAARGHQFLFGLFPPTQYWRPIFAFGLMFVALAPLLYNGLKWPATIITGLVTFLVPVLMYELGAARGQVSLVLVCLASMTVLAWFSPKRLLAIAAIYPFLAYWLLWGGTAWLPVCLMLGFILLGAAWRLLYRRLGAALAATASIAVAIVWWLWAQQYAATALHNIMPISLEAVRSEDFGGFLLAFIIGVTSIAASLPIGILLALGRRSGMPIVQTLCVGFIEFIRGVPLITVLFAANFMLLYFLPPRTNFDLISRVIIVVVLFSSAYIAEVIRGGLAGLPLGQYEAADSLGLNYWQAQRLIALPQALKISIPGVVSSFISLFKDTTLVALVGLMDPLQGVTKIVRADAAWKGIYWEPYIFVGAIFFIFCFSMSRYSKYLEDKLKTDHR